MASVWGADSSAADLQHLADQLDPRGGRIELHLRERGPPSFWRSLETSRGVFQDLSAAL